MRTLPEKAAAFVSCLITHQEDRGAMSALRRGLSPATEPYAWPTIARFGGQVGWAPYQIVGALFALHSQTTDAGNFGDTCRAVAMQRGLTPGEDKSIDTQFRRLLTCDSVPELSEQLRRWVKLAASHGQRVNYERLFLDIACWPNSAPNVKTQWARGFWNTKEEA